MRGLVSLPWVDWDALFLWAAGDESAAEELKLHVSKFSPDYSEEEWMWKLTEKWADRGGPPVDESLKRWSLGHVFQSWAEHGDAKPPPDVEIAAALGKACVAARTLEEAA